MLHVLLTRVMHGEGIHIALSAEKIASIFSLDISNTLLSAWLSIAVLLILAFWLRKKLAMIPGRFQALVEALFEYVLNYMEEVLENKRLARRLFPIIMTIFLFVLVSNWAEHLPFFETVKIHGAEGEVALFKTATADLNTTLALAIVSFFTVEILGVASVGLWKYLGKFINFSSPLNFAIGLIELISELARLIAFSFRLFGNILAGQVLLLVVKYFVPYLVPVPLMAFELFVGFIQAAIFALLTLYFVKLAIMDPEHAH